MSDFFKTKIEGSKNLGCSLEFDYTAFELKVIKWFLDYCYCVAEPIKGYDLTVILAIMDFLLGEGKTAVSGMRLKVTVILNTRLG